MLNPNNLDATIETLTRNMPNIPPEAVGKVMENLVSPGLGLTPMAALKMDGMRTVLELSHKYGSGSSLGAPESYTDLQFYRQALAIDS